MELPGIRLGVVRGISYGLFGPPDEFGQQARALGAGLIRAYVYWGQVEPRPGEFVWDTVDALLDQLGTTAEAWVTVCSSSPWATRQPTDFLPPSPAEDLAAYGRFVERLVEHCAGRVHYWQCDNEPSNTGLLWAGTAAEYVAQLITLHAAVKRADPAAAVVLGGCGYDVWSSPEGSEQRRFFDHVVDAGRDAFDLFSVNLYGDPDRIPAQLATARGMMQSHGGLKPIVAGEHGGPVPFEFAEAEAAMQSIMMDAFAAGEPAASQSTADLIDRAAQETPEKRAMRALYARRSTLPPTLQMFLDGCEPELERARHRINARQLVARTLLAAAGGVRRLAYWNLAAEVPGPVDPLMMMHLLFGKLPLLAYDGTTLGRRFPAADTFALLAAELAGAEAVTRLPGLTPASLYGFEVARAGREPLFVVWDRRDVLDGETQPPVRVRRSWPAPTAEAVDAFGGSHPVALADGELALEVRDTPVFVTPTRRP